MKLKISMLNDITALLSNYYDDADWDLHEHKHILWWQNF